MSIKDYQKIWGSKSSFAKKNKFNVIIRKETPYELKKRLAATDY